jgi:hypothetical protein
VGVERVVADKGYHSKESVRDLAEGSPYQKPPEPFAADPRKTLRDAGRIV